MNNFLVYTSFRNFKFIEKECEYFFKDQFQIVKIKGAKSFIKLAPFDINLLKIPEKKFLIIAEKEEAFIDAKKLYDNFKEAILSYLSDYSKSFKITIHNHLDQKIETREIEKLIDQELGRQSSFDFFDIHLRFDFFEDLIILSEEVPKIEGVVKENVATGMKGELGRAFALSGEIKEGMKVLDPFMGSGRILEECLNLNSHLFISGVEKRAIPFMKTKEKLTQLKSLGTKLFNDDFFNLSDDQLGRFDAIISDPPYGIQLNRYIDYNVFYKKLLDRSYALLESNGLLVVGVARVGTFEKRLSDSKFSLVSKGPFSVGKIQAYMYVLIKNS